MRPLADIEKDLAAATIGDWTVRLTGGRMGTDSAACVAVAAVGGELASLMRERDARFMVAAHTDVPDLIAEVRKLRGALSDGGEWLLSQLVKLAGASHTRSITEEFLESLRGPGSALDRLEDAVAARTGGPR